MFLSNMSWSMYHWPVPCIFDMFRIVALQSIWFSPIILFLLRAYSCGFESNDKYTCCSDKLSGMLTYMLFLENFKTMSAKHSYHLNRTDIVWQLLQLWATRISELDIYRHNFLSIIDKYYDQLNNWTGSGQSSNSRWTQARWAVSLVAA